MSHLDKTSAPVCSPALSFQTYLFPQVHCAKGGVHAVESEKRGRGRDHPDKEEIHSEERGSSALQGSHFAAQPEERQEVNIRGGHFKYSVCKYMKPNLLQISLNPEGPYYRL